MLLVVTNSQDATADFLISYLEESEIEIRRFNTDTTLETLAFQYVQGTPAMSFDGRWIYPADISTVWYRRPEHLRSPNAGDSPEDRYALSEWTEAIEGFFAHISREKWINHPSANSAAGNKLEQLSTAKRLGLLTPNTLVTHDPMELRKFFALNGERVIAKPMATANIERSAAEEDTQIYTNVVRLEDLDDLSDLHSCPTLFQSRVDKVTDVRITIIDDAIHPISLSASDEGEQRCDIRRDNMSDVVYEPIELPAHVVTALRALMSHYNLRFAAIDMAVTKSSEWIFFEVNANGQWAWLDIVGVSDIAASFRDVLNLANGR